MKIRIKSNKIILGDRVFDGYVYVKDGQILEVSNRELRYDKQYDFTDIY